MPKAFFRKAFDRWLVQNRGRFQHPPKITSQGRHHVAFSFRGVTQKIHGYVTRNGTTFCIDHAGQCVDMLNDIDIEERRSRDGTYFCALCLEPIHYDSRQALWEQHCFEPMLEWANASFQSGQWLHVYMTARGASWASITRQSVCESRVEGFAFSGAWPVLLPPQSIAPGQRPTLHHDSTRC